MLLLDLLGAAAASGSIIFSTRARIGPRSPWSARRTAYGSPIGRKLTSRPNLFESLDFPVANRKMEAFFAEFPLRSKPSPPHQHAGAELIYVTKGQLGVNIDGEDVVLDEGDAVYFDSGAPRFYRREGRSTCSAIVVVSPK